MDVVAPLVAYLQPPVAVHPRQRSFHDPPVSSQLLAGVDAPPSNSRGYAPLPQSQSLATSLGNHNPSQHGACWAVCVVGHEACGSVGWRLRPPRGPSSRGRRLQPCGSHRAGCLLGRPQRGAWSPVCPCPSDSLRSFGPPGAATLDESKDARSQSISSALPNRSKSF